MADGALNNPARSLTAPFTIPPLPPHRSKIKPDPSPSLPNGNYVDWSSQRVVTALDTILSNVLSKDSCHGGLDGIIDMLTDDGSVALPLEFEASVPLGGLANLSIALTWFNISGID